MAFLSAALGALPADALLFGGSASAFRRRWDTALARLQVSPHLHVTPAGLRGGGACRDYEEHRDVTRLLWKMRLQHLTTLQHYLQEVLAMTSLTRLPERARFPTRILGSLFEPVMRFAVARLQLGDWRPLSCQAGPGA